MKKTNTDIFGNSLAPATAEERAAMEREVEQLKHDAMQARAKISQLNTVIQPLQKELREWQAKEQAMEARRLDLEKRLATPEKLPYMGPRKPAKKGGSKKTPNDVMALFANMTPEQKAQLIAVLGG